MKFVVAILIFCVVILFHEFGHFLLARANGICVEEFCIGFGPTLLSYQGKQTKYSVKLVWFGGACIMKGEDEENSDPDAFGAKGVLARMSVVFAGPFFNFILAFVFSLVLMGMVGYDLPVITTVYEGSPAESAGLIEGDVILSMNNKKITVAREAALYLYLHPQKATEEVVVTYERDGEQYTVSILPELNEAGYYRIGIGLNTVRQRGNVFQTLRYAFHEVGYWIDVTLNSLKLLVTGQVSLNQLSGPVGIVKTIGDTYEQSQPSGLVIVIANMLNISILLSANLGVMNLLPIPALDGGRIVFLIAEGIRRKKFNPNIEGYVNMAGFAILILLMVLVMVNDIHNLI